MGARISSKTIMSKALLWWYGNHRQAGLVARRTMLGAVSTAVVAWLLSYEWQAPQGGHEVMELLILVPIMIGTMAALLWPFTRAVAAGLGLVARRSVDSIADRWAERWTLDTITPALLCGAVWSVRSGRQSEYREQGGWGAGIDDGLYSRGPRYHHYDHVPELRYLQLIDAVACPYSRDPKAARFAEKIRGRAAQLGLDQDTLQKLRGWTPTPRPAAWCLEQASRIDHHILHTRAMGYATDVLDGSRERWYESAIAVYDAISRLDPRGRKLLGRLLERMVGRMDRDKRQKLAIQLAREIAEMPEGGARRSVLWSMAEFGRLKESDAVPTATALRKMPEHQAATAGAMIAGWKGDMDSLLKVAAVL